QTCRLGGLFSLDEDFDDEVTPGTPVSLQPGRTLLFLVIDRSSLGFQDVLGTDWHTDSASEAASAAATMSSAANAEQEEVGLQQRRDCPPPLCDGATSRTFRAAAQNAALALRQIPPTTRALRSPLITSNDSKQLASQNHSDPKGLLTSSVDLDDFDDWDVDLADLDECDSSSKQPPPAAAEPSSSAKALRPSALRGSHDRTFREHTPETSGSSCFTAARRSLPANPGSSNPPQSPVVLRSLAAASPASSSFSNPQQTHKPWTTPRASPQAHGLFETVSPSVPPSALSPHPLHTPVLTNRLVQLVSASSKLPKKRPRSESRQRRTRRFPGPAGLLPQQPQAQNLDQIVVSVPKTPAHGAAVGFLLQASCSQTEEEEFSAGGWAAMKAEMGLDERNPSCFLHSYSVVMVLRKAALKQLARNKVPNMAVLLKSIIHTNADAKAVFRDPTGEMQGTVHRRLLEERAEELRVGAVLLLKQVGVFSPSHRNHYLNVTPNNLLRIYAPDGVGLFSTRCCFFHVCNPPPPFCPLWSTDDDLDELLGALPEDACSL
uniref:Homologous recombination factor with OB-fold n=1 Tax=Oryzias latipes TaxID=8090 RepID=A0A3B3I5G5_ORYLA